MERAADGKGNGAALAFFGLGADAFHGFAGAAGHKLAGRIVVGHNQKGVGFLRRFSHDFRHGFGRHLEQRGHAAPSVRVGFGHELPAQGHDAQHAFFVQHLRGGKGAEFAEAVPGGGAGRHTAGKFAPQVDVDDRQRGLERARVAHGVIVAFPEDFAQGQAADGFGALPELHGFGTGLGHIAPHAGDLRALTGEKKRIFGHGECSLRTGGTPVRGRGTSPFCTAERNFFYVIAARLASLSGSGQADGDYAGKFFSAVAAPVCLSAPVRAFQL